MNNINIAISLVLLLILMVLNQGSLSPFFSLFNMDIMVELGLSLNVLSFKLA